MNDASKEKASLKQRIAHEMLQYWINFVYLAIFFGAFAWYRRFILAEYHISYFHYGAALVEAFVLAKVILIGDALGLSRGYEDRPLIYATLRKALVFTLFVGFFAIVEHAILGLVHGKGVMGGLAELWNEGRDELVARCLVTFFAFIPFFAFRELALVLGEGKLRSLFFHRKPPASA
jgi:hypothetical protein